MKKFLIGILILMVFVGGCGWLGSPPTTESKGLPAAQTLEEGTIDATVLKIEPRICYIRSIPKQVGPSTPAKVTPGKAVPPDMICLTMEEVEKKVEENPDYEISVDYNIELRVDSTTLSSINVGEIISSENQHFIYPMPDFKEGDVINFEAKLFGLPLEFEIEPWWDYYLMEAHVVPENS